MELVERDKETRIFGGIAVEAVRGYAVAVSRLSAYVSGKQDLIPMKERVLAEIGVLKDQYLEMQQRLQQAQASAAKRGPLLTEIENITKRANLSSKVVSLKPQAGVQTENFKESIVEIKIENVTLYDIVNYVNLLERSTLRIRKLYFKPRFDNPKLLNSTILVSSAG